jgi:hypothetical protein
MSFHFIPYRNDKIRTVWKKIWTVVTVMGSDHILPSPLPRTDSILLL